MALPAPPAPKPAKALLGLIFTRDNLYHTLAALVLTPLIGPGGTTAVFLAREMEQAAPKGERWKPWRWSAHKHFEWLVPTAVAWLAYLIGTTLGL